MDAAHLIAIVGHGLGLVMVLAGILGQARLLKRNAARVSTVVLAGAFLLLATGVALALVIALTGTPNWPKLALKLVIAASIVTGLLVHRGRPASTPMLLGMAGLTLVNVAIAVAW